MEGLGRTKKQDAKETAEYWEARAAARAAKEDREAEVVFEEP